MVVLTVLTEDDAVESINSYETADMALDALHHLTEMGYVSEEKSALLEVDGTEFRVQPESGEAETTPSSPNFAEGDVVIDEAAAHWSETPEVEIVEVTDIPANEYYINETHTVATRNSNYPYDDRIIRARPVNAEKVYSYPESRLKEKE